MKYKLKRRPPPDTGCEYSPSCLACPRPICKYDDPLWEETGRRGILHRQIVDAFNKGLSTKTVAGAFGVSERTVTRVIAKAEESEDVAQSEDDDTVPVGRLHNLVLRRIKPLRRHPSMLRRTDDRAHTSLAM